MNKKIAVSSQPVTILTANPVFYLDLWLSL